MPSWTENEIRVEGKTDKLRAFLDAVKGDEQPLDFRRIIPRPAILDRAISGGNTIDGVRVDTWMQDEAEGRKLRLPTDEEAAELSRYDNWYDWSCANWGTKWNASSVELDDQSDWGWVVFHFDTASRAPIPIFAKLREQYPDLDFSFRWRDEDDPNA